MRFLSVLTLACVARYVVGDIYMHNMRGSNNRLNEQNAQRNNGDRLFNSQNNNRGGYNVGDRTYLPSNSYTTNLDSLYSPTTQFANNQQYQNPMVYYEKSTLSVEWTNQHGCGGNEKDDPTTQNCQLILQYACEMMNTTVVAPNGVKVYTEGTMLSSYTGMWDGTTTNRQFDNQGNNIRSGTQPPDPTIGLHESVPYRYNCQMRQRNQGLFIADQQLQGNTAQYTRQNPNGNRNGLECPEERDYYPYWSPSPWRDIVIMTDHVDKCPYYLATTQNTNPVGRCEANSVTPTPNPNRPSQSYMYAITQHDCEVNYKGTWVLYSHNVPPPQCIQAPWSRQDHLGNGRDGQPNMFNWTLPTVSSIYGAAIGPGGTAKCVLRLRYNISTDDYDPWTTDASSNQNLATGVYSPVTTDPVVDIGAFDYKTIDPNDPNNVANGRWRGVKLHVNTAQFGRTFQDRSHVFYIKQIPSSGPLANLLGGVDGVNKRILNLNVRGKRGNIVETYPSVEYDFVPNRLQVNGANDIIHIQWTGSNTHNNGGDGGDGQAGDAGQGTEGTDRQNFVLIQSFADNYPLPLDKVPNNFFSDVNCYRGWDGAPIGSTGSAGFNVDCSIYLGTSSFFTGASSVVPYSQTNGQTSTTSFDPLLNNAPASLPAGVFVQFKSTPTVTKEYYYMNTRNNNFSNRSQKATIVCLSPQAATTTAAPTTATPTTNTPSTANPTTVTPSTATPSTASPTTAAPSTATPTTATPTTATPSTAAPTTATPTTAAPSTASPTTATPTTVQPTTAIPTTSNTPTTATR